MQNSRRRFAPLGAALIAAAAVLIAALLLGCGGDEGQATPTAENLQRVSFQEPQDPGPDPFTRPADVRGKRTVPVSSSSGSGGSQPFGGSGSNRVCDRDKLIRFLRANPERMREWARVLGVAPRIDAVEGYIAKLHPVTLTRDTQVTNHSFRAGRAEPFQAILQAGTAVLVDKYGTPVVRCYCGNPLKPAVLTKSAECAGCPPHYRPPKQCEYGRFDDYDKTYYRRDYYSNHGYDKVFISSHRRSRYSDCYAPYPDPPVVTIVDVFEAPEPEPEPETETEPEPEPQPAPPPEEPGLQCDPPRSQLEAEQCAELGRPAPQPAPAPEPEPEPEPEPAPPTTTPDICNDGLDNEGVPGLVDGADPNCA